MTSTAARRDRRSLASSIGHGLVATIGFVLLPKCPLCIAAYLVSLGIGAEAASSAAPMMRPVVMIAVVASSLALLAAVWRRRRRVAACGARRDCCG